MKSVAEGMLPDGQEAAKLLNQPDAHNISMDMNYTDKVVLRRFFINDIPSFFLLICFQELGERPVIEQSVDQIAQILQTR